MTIDLENTRVIAQDKLAAFQNELAKKSTPFNVLLRRNRIPMGLLDVDVQKDAKVCHFFGGLDLILSFEF